MHYHIALGGGLPAAQLAHDSHALSLLADQSSNYEVRLVKTTSCKPSLQARIVTLFLLLLFIV